MSRKKDIEFLAHRAALIRGVGEAEARQQLAKESARKLRWRRRKVEWAARPLDPELTRKFDEVNAEASRLLSQLPSRYLPARMTVH
jgi:hypothetical protein